MTLQEPVWVFNGMAGEGGREPGAEGGREAGTWKKGRWKEAAAREEPRAVLHGG